MLNFEVSVHTSKNTKKRRWINICDLRATPVGALVRDAASRWSPLAPDVLSSIVKKKGAAQNSATTVKMNGTQINHAQINTPKFYPPSKKTLPLLPWVLFVVGEKKIILKFLNPNYKTWFASFNSKILIFISRRIPERRLLIACSNRMANRALLWEPNYYTTSGEKMKEVNIFVNEQKFLKKLVSKMRRSYHKSWRWEL